MQSEGKIHCRYIGDKNHLLERLGNTGLNLDVITRSRTALSLIPALMMVMAGRLIRGHLSARYIGRLARAQNRAMCTGPDQQAGEHEYELAFTQLREPPTIIPAAVRLRPKHFLFQTFIFARLSHKSIIGTVTFGQLT